MRKRNTGLFIVSLMMLGVFGCTQESPASAESTSSAPAESISSAPAAEISQSQKEEDSSVASDSSAQELPVEEKTMNLGSYPQTHVNDAELITALDALTEPNSKGWYEYEGEQYAKVSADPCGSEITMSDGTILVNGAKHWFKVEPIVWKVIDSKSSTIITDKLLTTLHYYRNIDTRTIDGNTVHANNYEYSILRAWMNGYDGSSYNADDYTGKGFYDIAFTEEEKAKIQTVTIDNSEKTTSENPNPYACNNTNDKVFALSYEEISTYWKEDSQRMAEFTDYALANYGNPLGANGYYWLRSPITAYDYSASEVYYDGALSWADVYVQTSGVRPALSILAD